MTNWFCAGLAILTATVAVGAETDTFALKNARIYTQNQRQPWAQSLIVSGDRIAYVGRSGTAEWN